MPSYYYEDFNIEDSFRTAGRTIDQSDINTFAGLSGDYHSLHTNDVYAKEALFGKRIAHGILTLAITSGLLFRSGIFEETGLGNLGSTEKYLRPVFPGDTIYAEITIINKKLMADKGGIVTARIDTINQDKKIVLTQEMNILLKCRENTE